MSTTQNPKVSKLNGNKVYSERIVIKQTKLTCTFVTDQDGIEYNEGQQQHQETVDPNWDSVKITTYKPNVNMNTYTVRFNDYLQLQ